jgi:GST-like protein
MFYGAQEFLQLDSYGHLVRWMELIGERPAFKRGMRVNGFGADAIAIPVREEEEGRSTV